MQWYISWDLMFLAALSALYGYTQMRCAAALGAPARRARFNAAAAVLSGAGLTVAWSVTGFALPVFYVLAYLCRAVRLVETGPVRRKNLFLLNLSFINTMALHLALIGTTALVRGVTMHALLDSGFWRTVSAAAVLGADIVEDLIFLRRPGLPAVLSAEAESEEARPFMTFLWFCTGYLLVDSLLCVAELEPVYPPLFLIGSIVILMYFILRFLLHINAIIRDNDLLDEHKRLSARLGAAQEHAGALKRMVDRDPLTGVLSRRHIMGRVDALMGQGEPFSLAFLDLDGLKGINDSEGHDAGDRYLAGFAQEVEALLGEGDLLARVGGDEFVVLMSGCGADAAARRIRAVRGALETKGSPFLFSYGVSAFLPGDGRSAEDLLQDADRAMYRDKEQRR